MNLEGTIGFTPTPSDVTRFNEWFDEKCIESGIEHVIAADLKLCINEVLSNLISYGLTDNPRPAAVVEIDLKPGTARAIVTDNGVPFSITEWQAPATRDLLNDEPGGFGIALIKAYATRLSYARIGACNRLEIVCEAPKP